VSTEAEIEVRGVSQTTDIIGNYGRTQADVLLLMSSRKGKIVTKRKQLKSKVNI
jgi:hypothetical protein